MRRLVEQEAMEAFREKIARSRGNHDFLLREGHTAGVKLFIDSFSLSSYNVLSILVDDKGRIISSTDAEYFGEEAFPLLKQMRTPFSENDFHAFEIQIKKVSGEDHREYLHGVIHICSKDAASHAKNTKNCGYFYSIIEITEKIHGVENAIFREIMVSAGYTFAGSIIFIYTVADITEKVKTREDL